jgi:ubiquinone biosynthesis protein Coq4
MNNLLRSAKGWYSGIRLLLDPKRLDDVFVLEEALADEVRAQAIVERLSATPQGAKAIVARRRLGPIDLARLRALPEGTFGRAFAEMMDARGLDPASLPRHPAPDSREYVRAHIYETHDLWHVALGFDTDIAGEIGVQAFYIAQIGGALPPVLVTGGLLHGLLAAPADWQTRFDAVMRGYTLGKESAPLFGVDWDALWDKPLEQVRAEIGLAACMRGFDGDQLAGVPGQRQTPDTQLLVQH